MPRGSHIFLTHTDDASKEKLLARKEAQYASFSPARSKHFELLTVQQNVKTILRGERQHTRTREHLPER